MLWLNPFKSSVPAAEMITAEALGMTLTAPARNVTAAEIAVGPVYELPGLVKITRPPVRRIRGTVTDTATGYRRLASAKRQTDRELRHY